MKTLYIKINNEDIVSSKDIDVFDCTQFNFENDFFYNLGTTISKKCGVRVDNKIKLITDFNVKDTINDFTEGILEQWSEAKTLLFCGEEPDGNFDFKLPTGYVRWLNLNENDIYRKIGEALNDNNIENISIDIEDLYENVEALERRIKRQLDENEYYKGIDEIVFNDDAITRKSPIVKAIRKKFEDVGFVSYSKFKELLKDKPSLGNADCTQSDCQCNTDNDENDLFPFFDVVLGVTSIDEFADKGTLAEEFNGFRAIKCNDEIANDNDAVCDNIFFITYPNSDKIASLFVTEVPVEGCKFPKKISDKLGVDFSSSYNDCQKELLKRNYKIRLKRNDVVIDGTHYCLFLAESPNKKYLLVLIFNILSRSKGKGFLEMMYVHLNKCPKCGSDKIWIGIDDYPFLCQCKNNKCSYEWTLSPKEDNDEEEGYTPLCPECNSDDVRDDGSDYLQYTCNDCNHNWGHDDTVECPECGSVNVENDGSDYLQYTCNDCIHNWGHDDTVECPECGSDNVENDGSDYLQYTCNDCNNIFGDDE